MLFLSFLDAKAAEAASSSVGTAYYDPNTHYAYVPPPYVRFYCVYSIIISAIFFALYYSQSNDAPPSYEESKEKKFK